MVVPGAAMKRTSGLACAGCLGWPRAGSSPSFQDSRGRRTLEKLHRIRTPEALPCKYQVLYEAAEHFVVKTLLAGI